MPGIENCYILINRLQLAEDQIAIAPGLTLRKIPEQFSVFDLAAAGAAGFREWAMLEQVAPSCTVELESSKDAVVTPGFDQLNRAWLASSLILLCGFGRQLPVAWASYSWSNIAGHKKMDSGTLKEQFTDKVVMGAINDSSITLPPFYGGLLDFHVRLVASRDFHKRPMTASDGAWIRAHFNLFNELCSKNKSFQFALEALADWRYSQDPRVAIARLWSGIESLFSVSTELSYRISIVAASLLVGRGEDRIAKSLSIKKLYGIRSKAVHGETLTQEKLADGVDQSFALLRDLLLVALEKQSHFTASIMDSAVMGDQ